MMPSRLVACGVVRCCTLDLRELCKPCDGMCRAVGADGVMRPLALLTCVDDARLDQDLHVMREVGLADLDVLEQVACALLARAQAFEHLEAVLVAERLEHSGVRFDLLVHIALTQIELFSYVDDIGGFRRVKVISK